MGEISTRTKLEAHAERLKYKAKNLALSPTGLKIEPKPVKNPLLEWPRNFKCVCGSGKKFKKCCLNSLARQVTIEDARKIKAKLDAYKESKK